MFLRKPKICFAPDGTDRGTPDDDESLQGDQRQQVATNDATQDATVAAATTARPVEVKVDIVSETFGGKATAALDEWFTQYCHNSPISRRTDLYSRIFQSVTQIKADLSQIKE